MARKRRRLGDPFDMDEAPPLEPRPLVVVLTCNSAYANEADVKFLDIEEDMNGRDLMTFECPVCGQVHKSYVLG